MVGQSRQLLHQFGVYLRLCLQVPRSLVPDRAKALFAAQLEDVPELRIHRFPLIVRQLQPRREQLLRLGFLQSRKIQVTEESSLLKVPGQKPVRHLPEKIACRVMPDHLSPFATQRKLPAFLDIVGVR
jgi:hypothetical protein